MPRTFSKLLVILMSVAVCAVPSLNLRASSDDDEGKVKQMPKVRMNEEHSDELKFNCNNDDHRTLSSFLAHLDADEATTVRVSGTCTDNLHITGIDRLTLLAAPGATINDASGGSDYVIIAENVLTFDLEGFTINGGLGVACAIHSTCLLAGNTIQNSLVEGVIISRSNAVLQGDTIQHNAFRGITATNGSNLTVAGETIQNNGAAGIGAIYGTNLNVQFSTINSNGGAAGVRVFHHSTLRLIDSTIQGNFNDGVSLETASAGSFENLGAGNTITGNAVAGVAVGDLSSGDFSLGPNTITGNSGGTDVVCRGQFPVTLDAKTLIGGGTTNCPN